MLGNLAGIAVDKLYADLLGEGELNVLAVGLADAGSALLNRLDIILDLGLEDTLLLGDDLTSDAREGNGLVDADTLRLGITNLDININRGDNGDIVGSLLGNLLAVLVAIRVVSMTISGLADGDHLGVGLLLEANLSGLGSGVLILLVVGVAADLIGDLLDGLSADGTGNIIAVLSINNTLDGKLNILTVGLNGGCADLGDLSHILDSAVVLGLLIMAIMRLVISGGRLVVSWGMVMVSRGGLVVSWLWLVGGLRGIGGFGGLAVVVEGVCGGRVGVGVGAMAVLVAVAVSIGDPVLGDGGEGSLVGPGCHEGQEEGSQKELRKQETHIT